MPMYEYECRLCGTVMNVIHGVGEVKATLHCITCDKQVIVDKLLSQSSFRLKWRNTPHDGVKTKVKCIGNQLYDENSYKVAKSKGLVK